MYVCLCLRRGCDGLFSYCIISWGGCVFTRAGWTLWTLMCPPVVYEPFRTRAPTHTHVQSTVHVTIYCTVERIHAWTIPYPKATSFIFSEKRWNVLYGFFALLPHTAVWMRPHSYRPKINTTRRVKGSLGGPVCCWHSFDIIYETPEEKHHSCPLLFINNHK